MTRRYLPGFCVLALFVLAALGQDKKAEAPDAARVKHVTGKWGVPGPHPVPLRYYQPLKAGTSISYIGSKADDPGKGEPPNIVIMDLDGKPIDSRACEQWDPCHKTPLVVPQIIKPSVIPASIRGMFDSATNAFFQHPEHTAVTISRGGNCGQTPADGIATIDQNRLNFNGVLDPAKGIPERMILTPILPASNASPTVLDQASQWQGTVAQGIYRLACSFEPEEDDAWVLVLPAGQAAAKRIQDLAQFQSAFNFWRDGKTDADFRRLIRGFLIASFEVPAH